MVIFLESRFQCIFLYCVQYGMSMSVLLRWEVGACLMFAVAIIVVEMNSVEGLQRVTSDL